MRITTKNWRKADTALTVLFGLAVLTLVGALLVGCTANGDAPGWGMATRDYADQVARDNAEAAETNPISAIIFGVSTLVASLAGAGVMIRRFDAAPFQDDEGNAVSEAEIVKAVKDKSA